MSKKSLAIFGEHLLANALADAFLETDFQVSVNQADPHTHIVIETNHLVEEKRQAMEKIETMVAEEALIVTSCLTFTATEIGSWMAHPERLIGFATYANFSEHELVEVAKPLQADSVYLAKTAELFQKIGLSVEVVEDEVGMVYPRILALIINEAAYALTEKIASAKAIDTAMKKGVNYPLGPLEWAEKIGIEDVYAVLAGLYRQFGEERYRPAPLIKKLVFAKWVGGETKKGFYHYDHFKNRQKELIEN
ncbi:3-hydroxybutyryl-CoA dehydrogenase [Alkalihalobacillus alcalophilus ATCC 27647 = CGMCC 1.3604]|uniref:3-hydroxybutyryl-CoA dehydrogenase n=1 Tax=Alkalihalobacillus alcalophilus ATCC 27647 = CGMCC 1.3604 TaxID=1218173 RepID=A0A094WIE2_ALKAL|nr:3-hydroxyacyl-CoA dehydrogenase family protein [Alkalihalobacillus alcalophilus]KGA95673.1 3-hydroxybutyryl-CoA dehydrogenase [Alkalihalobacillus alcalophilus ATCC 27647 = CGMCC 1.3604]MED1563755.1 3-hydroxyacyl-CoA dehydrogenase family protein [Alkalihalobacillus alcalophilus]THG92270.1 3-hydroxybutyryl-CoA dehydrogenase [Alkalihalobacillus alcalophilus ATCC 27647 = CGMCC 1.3604]